MDGIQTVTGDVAQTPAITQPGATTESTTSDTQLSAVDLAVKAAEAELAGQAGTVATTQGAQQTTATNDAPNTQASPSQSDTTQQTPAANVPDFKLELSEDDFATPEAYQRAQAHAKGFDEWAKKADAKFQTELAELKQTFEPKVQELESQLTEYNQFEEMLTTPEGRQKAIDYIMSLESGQTATQIGEQGDKPALTEDAIQKEVDRRLAEHPALKAFEQQRLVEATNQFADAALPVINTALQAKFPGLSDFSKQEMFDAIGKYESAIPTAPGTTQEQKLEGIQRALELAYTDRIVEAKTKAYQPAQTPPTLGGGTAPGLTPPGPNATTDERVAYAVAMAERETQQVAT
jgi:hypothetical protein